MPTPNKYKKWRDSHIEQSRAKSKAYYHTNKEKRRAYYAAWSKKNKEDDSPTIIKLNKLCSKCKVDKPIHQFIFRKDRRAYVSQCRKCTYLSSRPGRIKRKEEINQRYKTDPNFKLQFLLRQRIRKALKMGSGSKSLSTPELIGCSVVELKTYLESKFKEGMTWENHGVNGWHIDHIKPCASFDLTDPAQQKTCFHFTNQQPLWALDNLSKGCKIV